MSLAQYIQPLSGLFWRSAFLRDEAHLIEPANAPIGRWHHGGQKALYLSETPEGCRVATKAYRRDDDPPRGIFPIEVENAQLVDLRRPNVRKLLGASLSDLHVFWADISLRGDWPVTWSIGDQIRNSEATGILTPSRSRPDLTHLTLFRWNDGIGPKITISANPIPH